MAQRHPDFVLWLDLETTGSDSSSDAIIEVGCILTRWDLTELGEFSMVVRPARWRELLNRMKRVVYEMHDSNGLLADVANATLADNSSYTVEQTLMQWLRDQQNPEPITQRGAQVVKRMALAGSGVSHFDNRFIRRDWPDLSKHLTYWSLDVGSVRRMFGRVAPGLRPNYTPADKTHRALDDARMHLAEWRHYEKIIKQIEETH